MKSSRSLLLCVALLCVALLGVALYLQIVEEMLPCPLCVIQRYLFAAIALICIVSASLPPGAVRTGAGLGLLGALGGVASAGWHLWTQAHPGMSCGIDPLEASLNTMPTARLIPLLFKADGLCATPYPFLGLSIPQWSLIWFAVIALLLARCVLRRG